MTRPDIAETVRKFISPFTDPVFSELGEYVADRIRYLRFKNCINVLEKARKLLTEKGYRPQAVNPKVLVPLLEGAGLENDESMIDKWSKLLASASMDTNVPPSFPSILTQLTSREANILEWLFDEHQRLVNADKDYDLSYGIATVEEVYKAFGMEREIFEVAIDNMLRLRLLQTSGLFDTSNPYLVRGAANISFSILGLAFMKACRGPNIDQKTG